LTPSELTAFSQNRSSAGVEDGVIAGKGAPAEDFQEPVMRTKIVRTVAVGTIVSLGLAAVAFTPAAYATSTRSTARTATPHLAILTDPIQIPTRKAA
jgi:predicted SnoaL-like aldol condensation-catalyzing enzyme